MSAKEYTITADMLSELDGLYEARDQEASWQRQQRCGFLVDELRKIRRMVEAGVAVKIEGSATVLTTWQEFYSWAHGRYYLLEEGHDRWIGDDR